MASRAVRRSQNLRNLIATATLTAGVRTDVMRVIGAASALAILIAGTGAPAVGGPMLKASADDKNGFADAALGANGKTDLRVHSRQLDQTNKDYKTEERSNGVMVMNPPAGVVLPNIHNIPVIKKDGTKETYKPVVELSGQDKSLIKIKGDYEFLASITGDYTGYANQESDFLAGKGRAVVASAFVDPLLKDRPKPGAAAAAAYDPFTVPGGSTYSYAPVIDATLQLDDSSASGGVEIYAVDSTVFTSDDVSNFLTDGSPFDQTLWNLSLAADGPLGSTSGVAIDFELNPLALKELMLPSSYLMSLPGYRAGLGDAETAELIDAAIDGAIGLALVFADGAMSLQNFALFPASTLFQPVGGDVVYAEGVNAGLSVVPEPATLWLLGAMFVCLAGVGLRGGTRDP
jgi:hypothetical protein